MTQPSQKDFKTPTLGVRNIQWFIIFKDVHKLYFLFPRHAASFSDSGFLEYEIKLAKKYDMSMTRLAVESTLILFGLLVLFISITIHNNLHLNIWGWLAFAIVVQYTKIIMAYLLILFTGRYKSVALSSSP